MSTAPTPTPTCNCYGDHELARVLELMAAGFDQRTASLMVWAPEHPDAVPQLDDPPATWSRWAAVEVRRVANAARRALGMPALPAVPVVERSPG
ncbi:hypothetical protein [Nocardioides marmoraquaticus]